MMLNEFVAALTAMQRHQIIVDSELFEKNGSIGDCEMRRSAAKFVQNLNSVDRVKTLAKTNPPRIVAWMRDLTFEVLRLHYHQTTPAVLQILYDAANKAYLNGEGEESPEFDRAATAWVRIARRGGWFGCVGEHAEGDVAAAESAIEAEIEAAKANGSPLSRNAQQGPQSGDQAPITRGHALAILMYG